MACIGKRLRVRVTKGERYIKRFRSKRKLLPHIKAKIGTMKKEQKFYVMPDDYGNIVVESDNYVGTLNKLGHGVFSRKGKWSKPFTYDQQFTIRAMSICPAMGKVNYFNKIEF